MPDVFLLRGESLVTDILGISIDVVADYVVGGVLIVPRHHRLMAW